MTSIKDIFEYTQSFAPVENAESWDNCGLIVGDDDTVVSRAMLCLDITHDIVNEAKKLDCQLIISHHPVIFGGLCSVDSTSVVYSLIKNDIAALCLHTNLDISADGGVNICLADALKLTDKKMADSQYMCIGKLHKAMNCDEFAKYVKERLGCSGVRYTNGDRIVTVAVSSGAGGNCVQLNKEYGFDAIVTGEVKHHQFLYAAQNNLCVVEAGHFDTEHVVVPALCDRLSRRFSDAEFVISEHCNNPVHFL